MHHTYVLLTLLPRHSRCVFAFCADSFSRTPVGLRLPLLPTPPPRSTRLFLYLPSRCPFCYTGPPAFPLHVRCIYTRLFATPRWRSWIPTVLPLPLHSLFPLPTCMPDLLRTFEFRDYRLTRFFTYIYPPRGALRTFIAFPVWFALPVVTHRFLFPFQLFR